MTVTDEQLGARIRKHCELLLEKGSARLPEAASRKDWAGFARLTNGYCREALQLAMLEMRESGDLHKAKACLGRARDAAEFFAGEIEAIENGAVDASSLDIPIYCSLLAGDFATAQSIARFVTGGHAKFTGGDPFGIHVKVLAATVLDDLAGYKSALAEFNDMKVGYWWGRQRIYFDLYRLVLERNEEAFRNLLAEAVAVFATRATDKNFGNQMGEYGGLRYNQFAVDFMALGIARLAMTHEMEISLDTEQFPAGLIMGEPA